MEDTQKLYFKNFWNKLLAINENFGNSENDLDLQIP